MWSQEVGEFLLFRGLTPQQRADLAPLLSHLTFQDGETIFAQDDPAETVYVLEYGQVELRFQPGDGKLLVIATINQGNVFGWSAALGRSHYTSSAVCVVKSRALAIDGEKLRALIRAQPEFSILLGRMARTVAGRRADAQTYLINEEITRSAT